MGASLEEIAERLRVANVAGFGEGRAAVGEFLGEKVTIHHVPPLEGDGVKDAKEFAGSAPSEDAAYRRAMSDFHQEDVTVTVGADHVVLARTVCGTLADGTKLRIPIRNTYTVDNGTITAIEPHIAAEDAAAMRAAVRGA
jgi:hypothetical protein